MYYKNIPIWGHELILHKGAGGKKFFTGIDVSGIEVDVPQLQNGLNKETLENKILSEISGNILFKNTEKVIYLDKNKKAHLAYHLAMYVNQENAVVAPNYIIDANSGQVLKFWDDVTHNKIGQGYGGNVFVLPYRTGLFQHGDSKRDLPILGKFDVQVKGDTCFVESPEIRVINVAKTDLSRASFPMLSMVEFFKKPPTFSYHCSEKTHYVNKNDGNTAPANYSFSAVNDTMYFAGVTLEMYKVYYGVAKPLGDDLPLRAYTHVKNFDNAFAVPTVKLKGLLLMHQQIVIGDGDTILSAPAQGTIAHELSHNFTRLHSNLIYDEQSGGINEAFSDMASIAMQDYLRKDFPWYWDGLDWTIGQEATIGSAPLRYMDSPSKDGKSINNAQNYKEGMEVHLSSGVFNRAFYLLAHQPGWTVRKAFQVMVDANIKYWTSDSHFEAAACGVLQAAKDRNYDKSGVIHAFAEVGVECPVNVV